MDVAELERFLDRVLADGRLSRSELRSLRDTVRASGPTPERLAELRAKTFDRARVLAPELGVGATLDWVEGVVKALTPTVSAAPPSRVAFSPGEECLALILDSFTAAKRSVDVCVFTITDDRIAKRIVETHERGVRVRIISDDEKADDRGSDVDRLGFSGIEIRVDNSPVHMHHKFAVFDESMVLGGSYNWTRSAAKHNFENVYVTYEPPVVRRYKQEFERLWDDFE